MRCIKTFLVSAALMPCAVFAQSLDATFTNQANHIVYAIAPQTDGKVVVGGIFTSIGGQARTRIARIQADGTIESGFAPSLDSEVYTIAVERSGSILVGGAFSRINGANHANIGRLNSDGSVDGSFTAQANNYVFAINEQPDGKILVGGYFTAINGTARNHLARLNADGTLDASFNPNADNNVYSLTVQSDGKILIGGSFTKVGGVARVRIARLNADGSLDTGFNPGANNEVYSLVRQPDTKILVGGNFTVLGGQLVTRIGRLNDDGSVDGTFNASTDWEVDSVALQADGKIVLGGWFDNINGVARAKVGRINSDGSLDTSIGSLGFNNYAYAVSLLNDGKIMVGGLFTAAGATPAAFIARVTNPTAATQSISVDADGTTITWSRGGSSPEVEQTTFELSTDGGANFSMLASPVRVGGGWQLTGLSLPTGSPITIRARGVTAGGRWDASHSVSESSSTLTIPTPVISFTPSGSSSLNYLEDSAPVFFDNGITVADSLTNNFNGGSITISNLSGGTANDQIVIVNVGNGAGQIGVSGGTVSFGGAAIGTFPTSGANSGQNGQPLVISFNSASADLAAIQALVRQLAFSNNLDNPPPATRSIKLRAVDALAGYGTAVFNVAVIPVNDQPLFALTTNTVVVLEDSGAYSNAIIASVLPGGINETNQSITNYTVTAQSPSLFSAQPAINTNGVLTFTPAANANGATFVTVVAQDNGGTANGGVDKATNIFTINILPVNDAPSVTFAMSNVVVAEDSLAFTNLNFATFNPGPLNESGQTLVGYTLSNSSNALFSAQPAIDNFGTLTFTPAAGMIGTATVTVIVQDDGGILNGGVDKSTNTFTITIVPVNHAPSFTESASSVTVLEDSGASTTASFLTGISPGPANESGQVVTFAVTNDNNALFLTQPAIASNGTLTFTPATNANGSATVTVVAHDNGGTAFGGVDTSAPQTFTINVTAVNDAPTLAAIANRNVANTAGLQTVNLAGITTGPANESGQNILSITATSSDPTIVPNPSITYTPNNTTGTLSFTPVSTTNGVVTITVIVQDDGGTANGGVDKTTNTFTITVNVAPAIIQQPVSATVPLGGTTNFTVGATGTAPLAYQWFFNGGPVSGGTNPVLNFPSAQSSDAGSYYVIVSNAAGSVTSSVVTLTVTIPPGSVDPNFNPGANNPVMAVSYQTDGKILVGGQFSVLAGGARQGLGRLNTDGTLDTTYNASLNNGGEIYAIAPAGNGSAYVAGTFNTIGGASRYNIARLTANAVADSFNPSANNYVYALLPQPDGKLLVGGYFTQIGGTNRNHIARLNSDGSVDTTFNPNLDSTVLAMTLQPDGKILVGGVFTKVGTNSAPFVARLNPDGSFDPSFTAFAHSTVEAIIVQPDSKILLAGGFDYINGILRQRLARVDTNGVLETTFDATPGAEVFSMQLQLDGKVLIGGGFPYVGNPANLYAPHLHLARVNADGTMDAAYTAGSDGNIYALEFASDGKLFVGGQFNHLGSFTRTNLGRFMAESAATESITNVFGLGVAAGTTTLTWQRGGYGAEVLFTTLEVSTDGINFALSGQGVRFAGGWQFSNVSAPVGQTTYARLRAYAQGGRNNGSVSVLQSSFNFINPAAPPVILVPPADLTVIAGSPAVFTVTTSNAYALTTTYQWRSNGVDIGGATFGSYTNNPARLADSGNTYTVVVSNGFYSVTSAPPATLTVLLNTAPSFAKGADQTVFEDSGTTNVSGWATLISPGSQPVEAGQIVSFVVTNDNNALFIGQPAVDSTGKLTFTPALNANGSATVTIIAHDNGGTVDGGVDTSAPQTFTITVTAVNDAPTVTFATNNVVVLEDSGAFLGGAAFAAFSPGPPDEAMQTVSVVSVNNNNATLFSAPPAIDNSGTLTFTPAANSNGVATVTVIVQDNGGTANGGVDKSTNTFTITVTAVNDAPSFTLLVGGGGTVFTNHNVIAWGDNYNGQTNVPSGLTNVTAIAGGGSHSLALQSDGTVVAWGDNYNGQTNVPSGLTNVTAIAGGGSHSLALQSDGTVVAWGDNYNGQTNVPSGLTNVTAIAGGGSHSLALQSDGTVVAWGGNLFGQTNVPAGLTNVTAIAAGGYHSLALLSDGTVVAWGGNFFGQTNVPSGLTNVTAIAGGGDHSLALQSDGTVVAWGYNAFGQTNVPSGMTNVTAIAGGGSHSLALQSDGTVVAWGYNAFGQANVPSGMTNVTAIAGGGVHSLALYTTYITNGLNGITVLEDSGPFTQANVATNILAGPPDEQLVQTVSFTVTNDNNALFLVQPFIDPSNSGTPGALHFTPAPNANGSATVTVIAHDNGGILNGGVDTSAAQTFTITVTAVNDAPSVTLAASNVVVLKDSGAYAGGASFATFSPGPANESGQTLLGYTLSNDNNGLFSSPPAIDNSGTLTFTPATGMFGQATVTVVAQDSGGTANGGVDKTTNTFIITVLSSRVFVQGTPSGSQGETLTVPIALDAFGLESGVGFTLNFSAAQFTYSGATIGAGASGGTLLVNSSQSGAGRIGIVVAKPVGQQFAAGTNELVLVTLFVNTAATNGLSPLTFSSTLAAKEITDTNATVMPYATYIDGSASIASAVAGSPSTLEGDVSPRTNGNGSVTVSDAVQIARFATGLDTPTTGAGGEFQRADCAPLGTKGDGFITVADYVQALRFAAGLDTPGTVGGPISGSAMLPAQSITRSRALGAVSRMVAAASVGARAGQTVVIPVTLSALGNENSLGFSVNYDATKLAYVSASAGSGAPGVSLIVNANNAAAGRVGVIASLATGSTIAAGTQEVVKLTFVVAAGATGTIAVGFGDSPVAREIVDAKANVLPAGYTGGTVTVVSGALRASVQAPAAPGNPFRFSLGLDGGAQLTQTDLGQIEVWWADSPAAPAGSWTQLNGVMTLTNGTVQIEDAGAPGATVRFYKIIQRH